MPQVSSNEHSAHTLSSTLGGFGEKTKSGEVVNWNPAEDNGYWKKKKERIKENIVS